MVSGIGASAAISVLLRSILNRSAATQEGGGDEKAAGPAMPAASIPVTTRNLSAVPPLPLLASEEVFGLEPHMPGMGPGQSDVPTMPIADEVEKVLANRNRFSAPPKEAAVLSTEAPRERDAACASNAKARDDASLLTRNAEFHAVDGTRPPPSIAFDGADTPWRVMMMAIPIEGDAQVVRLLVQEEVHAYATAGSTSGRRFVVDTHLRRIGRTQIDGVLSADARLAVTLRHENPLPEDVSSKLRETSSTFAARAGLKLSLNLRETADDFVDLASPRPAGHRVGMSI